MFLFLSLDTSKAWSFQGDFLRRLLILVPYTFQVPNRYLAAAAK